MPGREFLELARELLSSGSMPRHWRAVRRAAIDKVPVERLSKAVRSGLETRPTGKLRPAGRLIIHAYYALLLECRDAMTRWRLPPPPRHQVHTQVKLRLVYAKHGDLKSIGYKLEDLSWPCNAANYDLRPLPLFASPTNARMAVQNAADALALLDAIDAHPARRAAAAASITP